MKKVIAAAAILTAMVPGMVAAQGPASGTQGAGTSPSVRPVNPSVTPEGNRIQNQNQVQNEGEETQLMTQQQQALQSMGATAPEAAVQRRNQVAQAVQAMVQLAGNDAGVGAQIKTMAQTQSQNQEKMEIGLEKIQSRNGLVRFLIGPDYGEIAKARKALEQNQLQVRELNRVMNQAANAGELQQLTEQIRLLDQVNTSFKNALDQVSGGFSLFGWLFALAAR